MRPLKQRRKGAVEAVQDGIIQNGLPYVIIALHFTFFMNPNSKNYEIVGHRIAESFLSGSFRECLEALPAELRPIFTDIFRQHFVAIAEDMCIEDDIQDVPSDPADAEALPEPEQGLQLLLRVRFAVKLTLQQLFDDDPEAANCIDLGSVDPPDLYLQSEKSALDIIKIFSFAGAQLTPTERYRLAINLWQLKQSSPLLNIDDEMEQLLTMTFSGHRLEQIRSLLNDFNSAFRPTRSALRMLLAKSGLTVQQLAAQLGLGSSIVDFEALVDGVGCLDEDNENESN